jgi:hypothetical protein
MTTTKLQTLSALSAVTLLFGFAVNAAPNPKSTAVIDVQWIAPDEVHIVSSKDISNVVITFCDSTWTKLEMRGDAPEFTIADLGIILAVSVKSGTTRTDPSLNPFGCDGGGGSN